MRKAASRTLAAALFATVIISLAMGSLASPQEPEPQATEQAVQTLVERYLAFFNARDVEGMLSMYSPEARISQKVGLFSTKWLNPEEYRPHLAKKMSKYQEKGTTITGYTIERLDLNSDDTQARLDLDIKVKQGVFHVTESGRMDLRRHDDGTWRIVYDDF